MSVDVARLPEAGRWRSLLDFYLTTMRTAVTEQLQYRVTNYFYMLGMVAEPVVYLVVWTTIARQQGGSVNGITTGEFAAYYIVWTLVRNMNIVFGAPFWEWRIREGRLAGDLLRPLNILHYDLAYFAGWKFVVVALWLPIAVGLSAVFHPDLHPSALQVVVFVVAIYTFPYVYIMVANTLALIASDLEEAAAILGAGRLAVPCLQRPEPFLLQVPDDDVAHDRLVVDDEDGAHRLIVQRGAGGSH